MLDGFQVFEEEVFYVNDLTEDPDNVNTHSEHDLAATRNSMIKFGQVEPLIVHRSTNKIIGGNGRLRLAKELGWETVRCIPVEGSPHQLASLAIVMNNKRSDFNHEKLVLQLQELSEDTELLLLTGFNEAELVQILDIDIPVEEVLNVKEKELDKRGITLQFSVEQKAIIDKCILLIREEQQDFSVEPADCIALVCAQWIENGE